MQWHPLRHVHLSWHMRLLTRQTGLNTRDNLLQCPACQHHQQRMKNAAPADQQGASQPNQGGCAASAHQPQPKYTASIQPAECTSCKQPAPMRHNLLRHTSPADAQASACIHPTPLRTQHASLADSLPLSRSQLHPQKHQHKQKLQKGADTTPKTRLPVARAAV